jgi:hypothetical protein
MHYCTTIPAKAASSGGEGRDGYTCRAVLRIHEILDRGSANPYPLTNESRCGSGSSYFPPIFVSELQDVNKQLFCFLLFEGVVHLHHFSKISHKQVTKQLESMFLLLFLLDDRRMIEGSESGAGSIPMTNGSRSGRPKNMWILNRNSGNK